MLVRFLNCGRGDSVGDFLDAAGVRVISDGFGDARAYAGGVGIEGSAENPEAGGTYVDFAINGSLLTALNACPYWQSMQQW